MNLRRAPGAIEQFLQDHDAPAVSADTGRCVHALCKTAACDLCESACPRPAISLKRGLTFDPQACVGCGVCLHRCPMGVFTGQDRVAPLLRCVAELPNRETLTLLCGWMAAPVGGLGRTDTMIKTAGCLAALGPSAHAGLAALGVRKIILRLDSCAACAIGMLRTEIEATAGVSRTLLEVVPLSVECTTQRVRSWRKPEIIAVNHPPVSRRAFFRRLAGQANAEAALLTDGTLNETGETASANLPHERRRLLRAMRHIDGETSTTANMTGLPARLGFASMQVSSGCTACGTCVRACPTKALGIETSGSAFQLTFSPAGCTDCSLCISLCPAHALTRTGTSTLQAVLDDAPQVLAEGMLRRCKKCGVHFAGAEDAHYCPVCALRRARPFG